MDLTSSEKVSKIRIIRESDWYASALMLKVYIDGRLEGKIGNNDYKDFVITADVSHEIYVKIEFFRSPKTPVRVAEGKSAIFRVCFPSVNDWMFILFDWKVLVLAPISTDFRV